MSDTNHQYADPLWWGYIHQNDTIQPKRFFDFRDIIEAHESPFVKKTYGPFPAKDRNDAIEKIKKLHKEGSND